MFSFENLLRLVYEKILLLRSAIFGADYHIYSTRNDTRSDIVDYIEMFYNSKRRHSFNNLLSPVEYEEKFTERLVSV